MHVMPTSPQVLRLPHLLTHWIVGFLVAALLALAGMAAHAAPPPAGTSISNQASATYTDAAAVSRTVSSNTVSTTVTQVASLTLTANGAQNASPGSVVYYPHTLTNTGNGADTFTLGTSNAGAFTMANVQIFADNGSGLPTGPAITSSGPLAANGIFRFVVVGTLPAGATAPQTNTITVTVTSVLDNTKTASNTDVTTVSSNAVVTLTKSVSSNGGAAPSGPYTYTLTYTNTGNNTATAVAVTDVLPAGMVYVAGSARWSVTGATPLSDSGTASGSAPNTLTSSYTIGTKTFLATLNQVTAGQSGTLSFQVNIATGTAPGVLNNTATSSYNNGASTVSGSSNTVPFTVAAANSVTMTGQTVASAVPGQTVSFTNVVTNTGSGVDTFNITITANSFPAGTTGQLYKSDGVTPLVDTNGDGTIDTGPLAPGASYNVILKGTLPPNASGGPFTVTKTATSVADPTKTATANDTLTLVTGAKVDLTNNLPAAAGVPGLGVGPEATAQVTNAVNPGASTTFTLVANNTGTSADSYDLAASNTLPFPGALPAGWAVTFKADGGVGAKCSTTGATITNTGSIPAGGNSTFCAVVTVPPGFAAGTQDMYFRALSPTSALSDIVHDAVTVNAVRSITITPNGSGQTYPGGSVVYSHTLTNAGNAPEGNGTLSTVTLATSNNQPGFTSVLYFDTNNNGVLDAGDAVISGSIAAFVPAGGLAPGASITIFDKVIAASGAVPGAVNVTTITGTTTNGSYVTTAPVPAVATDTTTVVAGNLTLTKAQAVDLACTGPTGGTVYSASTPMSVKPGQCILYQVTVTNVGASNATSVVVSDATPTYTTMSPAASSQAATTVGTVTGPAAATAGTISATVGTLAAGQSAVVTFGVKVNP